MRTYKARPRNDRRGADLISDTQPFGSVEVQKSRSKNRWEHLSNVRQNCTCWLISGIGRKTVGLSIS
jgi:hypothetical protein